MRHRLSISQDTDAIVHQVVEQLRNVHVPSNAFEKKWETVRPDMDKMLAKAAEPPNNSQKAVAKCILAFVAEEKRQAWKIESGYGKSR